LAGETALRGVQADVAFFLQSLARDTSTIAPIHSGFDGFLAMTSVASITPSASCWKQSSVSPCQRSPAGRYLTGLAQRNAWFDICSAWRNLLSLCAPETWLRAEQYRRSWWYQ
jgi:hypothetical protein